MKASCLLASCLLASLRVTAFAPPPSSFSSPRWHTSSPRWHTSLSGDSGSSISSSSSGDFSLNDIERELRRRRAAEETSGANREAQAAADTAAAAAVAAASSPGLEEGEAFMEEQMMLRKTLFKAHVLVYNQGQPEEGVYTLFVQGRNVLRAWQDKPEAARYALMLRAEDLPLGKPTELPMSQIIGFCKENGVGLELVPSGRGLQPPSRNKPEFDFDCSSSQGQDGSGPGRHPEAPRRDDSLFTPQELARIKKQFEKSLEGNTDEDQ